MSLSGGFKENGAATAAELAEFMHQLKGKRPQEVLGLVAQSGLAQGMISSTVLVAVTLVLFTVAPYGWGKMFPAEQEPVAKQPAATASEPDEQPAAAPAQPAAPAAPAAAGTTQPPAGSDILERLGEAETIQSNPLENPLEAGTDDLLKDLD